jgi:putative ABC transport system permease protein
MGARRGDVGWLFLAEAARLTSIGVTLGTVTAAALGNAMSSQLFRVTPWDPMALAAGVMTVALVAGVIPAIRASRVNPIELFR